MPIINFLNPSRDACNISAYSRAVLKDRMANAGISQITITSTARTVADQARIMHENIERHGVEHQKALYGSYGDQVIDEYAALVAKGLSRAGIIAGMTAKVNALGPERVSRHAADPRKLNVVDIAPSSINLALRKKFEAAVHADQRVSKFITPPGDPAYHLEIPQPGKEP